MKKPSAIYYNICKFLGLTLFVGLFLLCGSSALATGGNPPADTPEPLQVSTTDLQVGQVDIDYGNYVIASGGSEPYTWELAPGSVMPTGLSFADMGDNRAYISGSPSVAVSNHSFSLTVTDSAGDTATAVLSLTIIPAAPLSILTTSLPEAAVGGSYGFDLEATGGTGSYIWNITTGGLGTSFYLGGAGAQRARLNGDPASVGIFTIDVNVTDSLGYSVTEMLTLQVYPALEVSTISLPDAYIGGDYNFQLEACDGVTPYLWMPGFFGWGADFPDGLQMTEGGLLYGVITEAYDDEIYVGVVSNNGAFLGSDGKYLALKVIDPGPVEIITTSLLNWTLDEPGYSYYLNVTGGVSPYTYSLIAGDSLPLGLNLDSNTGQISGQPTSAGTYNFTVQVSDSQTTPATDIQALSITIVDPPPPLELITTSD
ncbi:MAG: Ig domain-containing protein, partial [bacterium]